MPANSINLGPISNRVVSPGQNGPAAFEPVIQSAASRYNLPPDMLRNLLAEETELQSLDPQQVAMALEVTSLLIRRNADLNGGDLSKGRLLANQLVDDPARAAQVINAIYNSQAAEAAALYRGQFEGTSFVPGAAAPGPGGQSKVADMATDFMRNVRVNPNTGNRDWNMWCLGFVNQVSQAANGKADGALTKESAKESYAAMLSAGRIHPGVSGAPAGAAVYWPGGKYGHIAIFSGRTSPSGEPMIITTGGFAGISGIQEVPLSKLRAALGEPAGWAAI